MPRRYDIRTEKLSAVDADAEGGGASAKQCQADLRCAGTDHVEYLPREAPVFDQWGISHYVSSRPHTQCTTHAVAPLPSVHS